MTVSGESAVKAQAEERSLSAKIICKCFTDVMMTKKISRKTIKFGMVENVELLDMEKAAAVISQLTRKRK